MALDTLFASEALRRLVVHFVVHPDQRLHFRALQRHLELSRQSLRNALDRLESLGLIRSFAKGRKLVYEVTDHPGWRALREMVRAFADPADVLGEVLSEVPGIRAAFLFGSAAKETMRPDSDVDLFVLGDEVDATALGGAALTAGVALGREIDVKRYTYERLEEARNRKGTGYVRRVLEGPKRWVIGSPESLASE